MEGNRDEGGRERKEGWARNTKGSEDRRRWVLRRGEGGTDIPNYTMSTKDFFKFDGKI